MRSHWTWNFYSLGERPATMTQAWKDYLINLQLGFAVMFTLWALTDKNENFVKFEIIIASILWTSFYAVISGRIH
jgi:hypothetical protein